MALTDHITVSMFRDAFVKAGRKDQYSYHALAALHAYYEELSDSIGEDIEFDVVGICCDWAEYDDLDALKEDVGDALSATQSLEDAADALDDEYTVLRVGTPTHWIHSLLIAS